MEESLDVSTTVDTSSDVEETSTVETTSESTTDDDISNALDEIDNEVEAPQEEDKTADAETTTTNESTETKKTKENSFDCPEKFKREDGTPDVEKILTSYKDLEANFTKKTQELNEQLKSFQQAQEQARMAELQQKGYESEIDYQLKTQIAQNLANGYMQYVNLTEEPDYVQKLLYAYAAAPTQNLLEEIEDNFGIDVIKEVTRSNDRFANSLVNQYQAQQAQQYDEHIRTEATNYVNAACEAYPEWFERQEFVDFFADALRTKGDSFQASEFVNHIQKIWDLAQKTLLAEQAAKGENSSAIKSLIGQTPKSSAKSTSFDLENCTEEELALEISKLI